MKWSSQDGKTHRYYNHLRHCVAASQRVCEKRFSCSKLMLLFKSECTLSFIKDGLDRTFPIISTLYSFRKTHKSSVFIVTLFKGVFTFLKTEVEKMLLPLARACGSLSVRGSLN